MSVSALQTAVDSDGSTVANDFPQIGTCLMSDDISRSPNSLCFCNKSSSRRFVAPGDSDDRKLRTHAMIMMMMMMMLCYSTTALTDINNGLYTTAEYYVNTVYIVHP